MTLMQSTDMDAESEPYVLYAGGGIVFWNRSHVYDKDKSTVIKLPGCLIYIIES